MSSINAPVPQMMDIVIGDYSDRNYFVFIWSEKSDWPEGPEIVIFALAH